MLLTRAISFIFHTIIQFTSCDFESLLILVYAVLNNDGKTIVWLGADLVDW